MRTGRIDYAPDYHSERRRPRVRAVRIVDLAQCQWCGAAAEIETLRTIEVLGKKFKVCKNCPPPDNANAART